MKIRTMQRKSDSAKGTADREQHPGATCRLYDPVATIDLAPEGNLAIQDLLRTGAIQAKLAISAHPTTQWNAKPTTLLITSFNAKRPVAAAERVPNANSRKN